MNALKFVPLLTVLMSVSCSLGSLSDVSTAPVDTRVEQTARVNDLDGIWNRTFYADTNSANPYSHVWSSNESGASRWIFSNGMLRLEEMAYNLSGWAPQDYPFNGLNPVFTVTLADGELRIFANPISNELLTGKGYTNRMTLEGRYHCEFGFSKVSNSLVLVTKSYGFYYRQTSYTNDVLAYSCTNTYENVRTNVTDYDVYTRN